MMKKLLILVLVLGMASMASATIIPGLLQISVNGNMSVNPPVLNLNVDETCTLDIFTDVGIPTGTGMDMVLIVATSCGTITGGVALKPNGSAGMDPAYLASENVTSLPGGQDGGVFAFGTFDTAIPGMTKIYDYITFQCKSGNGDTIVTLAGIDEDWDYGDPGVIYDQVTIHQVPEPATIALLGLGGLLLRRRK
jgi:hypothetical protein